MKIYKVGIIGCGRMGWLFDEDKLIKKPTTHIGAYFRHKKTKVIAVCDINKKRLNKISKKYNIQNSYLNYREMLKNKELDIISICTPTELHSKICIEAAKSGVKAIFCEKPIATSIKEAEDMIKACKKNNVKLIINHTRRWDVCFRAVNHVLDKKIIGKINLVNSFSTVGLLNGGTHLFDLLRQYFGDVDYISGLIIPDKSTDPGGRGFIKFKKNLLCSIDSSWRDYVLFGADIYGDKGMIKIGGMIRSKRVFDLFISKKSKNEKGIKELEQINYKIPKWAPPILNSVKNIVNSLENQEKILCSGEDGKASLEIALAFHESSRKKSKRIYFPLKNKKLRVIPRATSFTKDGKLR